MGLDHVSSGTSLLIEKSYLISKVLFCFQGLEQKCKCKNVHHMHGIFHVSTKLRRALMNSLLSVGASKSS